MTDDVASIGEILRDKRESKGLSLEEVHEATKITVENLTALEENRFDAFPNKVYARAFLRDYANFLGLDSAVLLARYEDEWQTAEPVEPAGTKRSGRPFKVLAYIVSIGAICVIVVGVWGFLVAPTAKVGSYPTRVQKPVKASKPAKVSSEFAPPLPESASTASPTKPVQQPTVPDRISLQVSALRDVWVRVKCDGVRVYESIMPKGSSKTFSARQFINVRAGMAGAVQLTLNGVPQPPLGTLKVPGEKTFRLTDLKPH
jgi:cytoskeletal protein RodZ